MRTLTLARMGRALMIAAAMIMLPQLASAQLAVTSKTFVMQDGDAGQTITLAPATEVTTSYTLTFPAAKGGLGSFLYSSNTDGGLSWSNTPTGNGYYPRWDTDADGSGNPGIVWTDPAGADNPNWSLTGNALTATGKLGTTTNTGIDFITNNDGATPAVPLTRMQITAGGAININTLASGGTATDIGRSGHTTTVLGATNINATGTDATSIGTGGGSVSIGGVDGTTPSTITSVGTLGHTGSLTLVGTESPLIVSVGAGSGSGTAGDVLVSKGTNTTPEWKSLNDATGIKKMGKIAINGDGSLNQTVTVTGMLAGDAVLITLQTTSGVYAVVTDTDADQFTVQYSGSATGSLVYMVMDTTP